MRIAQHCNEYVEGGTWIPVLRLQIAEHDVDDMPAARGELVAGGEVAAENGRERVAVREIEEAERRDADIELNRIDALAERAGRGTALEQRRDHADQRRMQLANASRLLQIAGAVEVLGRKQAEKFRVLDEIAPGELDQLAHAVDRIALDDVEPDLGRADGGVGGLEHCEIEPLLVAEIVVDHPLVG